MCELLDRVEAKGRAQGLAEGLAQGLEEGRAQGIKEGILKSSAEFVRDGLIPLEEAAKRMNLTPAEFEQKAAAYLLKK